MNFEVISEVTGVETFARGIGVRIRDHLNRTYAEGRPTRWRKRKGFATVAYDNGQVYYAEVHWFEAGALWARDRQSKDDRQAPHSENQMTYVRCINNQTLWKDDLAETYDPLLIVGHVYKVAPPQENDGPGWLRIFGEDGEDYLYPAAYFEPFHPEVTVEAEASITAHLPPDIKQLVRAEALSTGKTVSGLVREWIEERLDLPVAA